MQQIAKMFATLGFNVDSTGLDTFKGKLKEARADSALLSRNFRALKSAVDSANASFMRFNTNNKIKKLGGDVASSYTGFSKAVDLVNKSFASIGMQQPTTTKALGKINAAAVHGAPKWKAYGDELARVDGLLKSIQRRLRSLGGGRPPPINPPANPPSGGGGRPRGGGGGNGGGSPNNGWNFGGNRNNPFSFFRSMSPAVLLGGGLPAAGYGLKEVVDRGREQQKMENVLQFSSKGLADFNDSLTYVKKTALEVGVASSDLGKAFAQINMSAEGLNKNQKKSLMTNMSTSFAVMGASKDEQGLLFKAVNQMFSLGRIQAEEMNQLTGQGLVPRKLVYDAVKEAYKVKTNEEVQKLQKANKLDPAKIMPIVFQKMMDQAEKSGALAKYKDSSLFKQSVAKEKFNNMSQAIMQGGLDKALGAMFDILTELMKVLGELAPTLQSIAKHVGVVAKGWKALNGVFNETFGEGTLLKTILVIIIGLLVSKTKKIAILTRYARTGANVFAKFGRFLKGGFGMALKFVFTKINVLITALWLLSEVGIGVNKKMNGELSWVDVWIAKFDLVKAQWSNMTSRMALDWELFQSRFIPWKWDVASEIRTNLSKMDERKNEFIELGKQLSEQQKKRQNSDSPAAKKYGGASGSWGSVVSRPSNSNVTIPVYIDNKLKTTLNYDFQNQNLSQTPFSV